MFVTLIKNILRFAFPVDCEELRRGNGAMRFSVRSFSYALIFAERRHTNEKDSCVCIVAADSA